MARRLRRAYGAYSVAPPETPGWWPDLPRPGPSTADDSAPHGRSPGRRGAPPPPRELGTTTEPQAGAAEGSSAPGASGLGALSPSPPLVFSPSLSLFPPLTSVGISREEKKKDERRNGQKKHEKDPKELRLAESDGNGHVKAGHEKAGGSVASEPNGQEKAGGSVAIEPNRHRKAGGSVAIEPKDQTQAGGSVANEPRSQEKAGRASKGRREVRPERGKPGGIYGPDGAKLPESVFYRLLKKRFQARAGGVDGRYHKTLEAAVAEAELFRATPARA